MNLVHVRQTLLAAAVGACLSVPFVVQAQGTAPTKSSPSVPATTVGAPITIEQRAAIKELLDVMNTRDGLTKAFQAMSQSLAPQMGQLMNRQIEGNAALSVDQKQKMRQSMDVPFQNAVRDATAVVTNPKLVDETIEKMYPIYASHFSTAEIKQLTAFYKSPLGAKVLATMPEVTNESIQAGITLFTPRVNAIIEKTMKTQFDAVGASSSPAPAPAKK